MALDFTLPLYTKSGFPVRLICTDRKGKWPIVGLYLCDDSEEYVASWSSLGIHEQDNFSLINITKQRGWVNIVKNNYGGFSCGRVWFTRDEAIKNKSNLTVATIELSEWAYTG